MDPEDLNSDLDSLSDPLLEERIRQRVLAAESGEEKWTALAFRSPEEFGEFFHPALSTEESSGISLYPWQRWASEEISKPWTREDPLLMSICAANGSGKDAYVIALAVVWAATCKIRCRVIVTSSSFSQLSSQTEAYIRSLAYAVNDKLQAEVCVINRGYIFCNTTGSEIKMFATDDPGKAEGYHPFPDYPKGQVMLVINEAKTVENSIFDAFLRCTYSIFLLISSPGSTEGFFYNICSTAHPWNALVPRPKGEWLFRKISADDCPHITHQKRETIKKLYGEFSPLYRSSILAEFTSENGCIVITRDMLRARKLNPPPKLAFKDKTYPLRAGADFSAGGDESVSIVVDGNKVIDMLVFSPKNQVDSAEIMANFWSKYTAHGLKPSGIYGDDGGIGRATIDILERSGWPINRVLNQSRALYRVHYGNRGAELWFMVAKLYEENCLLPPNDELLITQLGNRFYTKSKQTGATILESKREAKAHGHGSPDRADAYVLAYSGVTPEDFEGWEGVSVAPETKAPESSRLMDWNAFAQNYRKEITFGRTQQELEVRYPSKIYEN